MRPLPRPRPALAVGFALALALLAGGGAAAHTRPATLHRKLVEVVVTLPRAPLALAAAHDRILASAVTRRHALDLRAPAAVSYVRTLAAAQREFAARLTDALPAAHVRWRYDVALDGVSVVLPASQLAALRRLPGATVWPSVTYRALGAASPAKAETANKTASLVDAPTLWGPNLATAGQGMKIAVVDDGIDQTHQFFDPSGYSYPAGFPKGNTAYTTPKVIVARAFPAPGQTWKYAAAPYDPVNSDHATHVAGIAAGDYDTTADVSPGGVLVSGVAPRAYLGNYKALTVPTKDWGLDGNSPEIAKAIDQAVADGMNVINLSLGEPEVTPKRDIVVRALENAAAAGVVPVVAAGNDFTLGGYGTVNSPGTAPSAITVGASSEGGDGTAVDDFTWFSSTGPTPVSLELKPDVAAPGENVLSSIPPDSWDWWDGTSMATPVVSGAAALLMQRHPTWTVEEIKSALESTGDPVHALHTTREVSVLQEGGGRIDLAAADDPLVFTDPTSLDWGLVERGSTATRRLALTDAGGGSDPWTVSVRWQSEPAGATLTPATATAEAGETLSLTVKASETAHEGDGTGFVVLTRGSDVRRIPFWFHVEAPKLPLDPHRTLRAPGVYHGDTAGRAARVSTYRWPERGLAPHVPTRLGGPEQVFRFTLRRPVANFGIVVLSHGRGVSVSPRLVSGDDENRLVGYDGLPVAINPYQGLYTAEPAVGSVLPKPGVYEFVFDTPTGGKPGPFTFRFWVNDTTPPTIRLLHAHVAVGQPIRFAVTDAGSGVDPRSLHVTSAHGPVRFSFSGGILTVPTAGLRGAVRLTVTAADWQESKNMEDVGGVLPNTRVLTARVRVG